MHKSSLEVAAHERKLTAQLAASSRTDEGRTKYRGEGSTWYSYARLDGHPSGSTVCAEAANLEGRHHRVDLEVDSVWTVHEYDRELRRADDAGQDPHPKGEPRALTNRSGVERAQVGHIRVVFGQVTDVETVLEHLGDGRVDQRCFDVPSHTLASLPSAVSIDSRIVRFLVIGEFDENVTVDSGLIDAFTRTVAKLRGWQDSGIVEQFEFFQGALGGCAFFATNDLAALEQLLEGLPVIEHDAFTLTVHPLLDLGEEQPV
jgi:hypothetical protein